MTIYLDNASSVPVSEESISIITESLKKWHNPNGIFKNAINNKTLIENARQNMLNNLHGSVEDKIIFTSSGSESNNLALDCINYAIVYDPTSHSSIINKCRYFKEKGYPIYPLDVSKNGSINLISAYSIICQAAWNKKSNNPRNVIVSICGGNNENGTIQDLSKIRNIIETVKKHIGYASKEEFDIFLHVDAVQLLVDRKINVIKERIDMLTISGHKIGSPYGIAALYIKHKVSLSPIIFGEQEFGIRGGTENIPYILSLAHSLESIEYKNKKYVQSLQRYFIMLLLKIDCCHLIGQTHDRLSNNIACLFKGFDGQSIVNYLDIYGIECSTGSACNSFKREPSHVLISMGYTEKESLSEVRFSLNETISIADIDYTIKIIRQFIDAEKRGDIID